MRFSSGFAIDPFSSAAMSAKAARIAGAMRSAKPAGAGARLKSREKPSSG